jgi:hypothetical protein
MVSAVASVLLVGFCLLTISAQEQTIPSRCRALPTKYPYLVSDWDWINNNEVVFSVTNYFRVPAIWYKYTPSTNQLTELTTSPYLQNPLEARGKSPLLTHISKSKDGVYEAVRFSPSGNQFIYGREENNKSTLMLVNEAQNLSFDLGISFNMDEVRVFWSSDENTLVFQNSLTISLVQVQDGKATIKLLNDIAPLSNYDQGFRNIYHRLIGISPDGTQVLFQPDISPPQTWVLDIANHTLEMWPFTVYADRVVWLNKRVFKAFTNLGVIEYDLATKETNTLIPRDQINSVNTLSPDGKYMLGGIYAQDPTKSFLMVCNAE